MTTEQNQARLEQLLKEHGFKFEIGGCGCCSSPWVKAEYNGEVILNDSGIDMDMFKEEIK
jgi:hypothetical protein